MSASASSTDGQSSDPSYPRVFCVFVKGKYTEGLVNCPRDMDHFMATNAGVQPETLTQRPCLQAVGAH